MANTSEMPVKEQSVSKQATASTNADNEFPVFTTKSGGSDSNESCITVSKIRNPFQKKPFVIGVAGGTASGKSTVCSKIMDKLGPNSSAIYNEKRVICISQDSFYRKLSEEDRLKVEKGNFNFDHPSAFDVNLLVRTLREVQNGRMVKVPVYNYFENQLGSSEEVIYPADVVLVEGLLLFYFPEVREMFHMKIFVDTDPDTRLSRRVMRDVNERHRGLDVVLSQYTKFVKPSFEEFCLPTKKYADIIVPRGPDNEVAIDLIVQTILDVVAHNQQTLLDFVKKSADDSIIDINSTDVVIFNSSGVAVTRRRVSKGAHDMRLANDDNEQRPRRTRYYSDSSTCRIVEQGE